MGKRTGLGLGIAGAVAILGPLGDGLFRANPWGLNIFLFAFVLVVLTVALASPSADAISPLSPAVVQLRDPERRAVEANLGTCWTSPACGHWRTYNLSRSRAREAVAGLRVETGAETSRCPGRPMRSLFGRVKKPGYTLSISASEGNLPQEAYVEVRRPNGQGWCARLHTPESVRTILEEWRRRASGEASAPVSTSGPRTLSSWEISHDAVVALVDDLISEGELELAFVPIG